LPSTCALEATWLLALGSYIISRIDVAAAAVVAVVTAVVVAVVVSVLVVAKCTCCCACCGCRQTKSLFGVDVAPIATAGAPAVAPPVAPWLPLDAASNREPASTSPACRAALRWRHRYGELVGEGSGFCK